MQLIYRGITYETSAKSALPINDEITQQSSEVAIPQSFVRLKYRGLPYIRFYY